MIYFAIVVVVVMVIGGICSYRYEKRKWNGGICAATGKPWIQFDTDSQMGRMYKDGEGNYTDVSWPCIRRKRGVMGLSYEEYEDMTSMYAKEVATLKKKSEKLKAELAEVKAGNENKTDEIEVLNKRITDLSSGVLTERFDALAEAQKEIERLRERLTFVAELMIEKCADDPIMLGQAEYILGTGEFTCRGLFEESEG